MRALTDLDVRELSLVQPSAWKGRRELRAGEELVGLIEAKTWSGTGEAEAADGAWRFERQGGFRSGWDAKDRATGGEVARLRRHRNNQDAVELVGGGAPLLWRSEGRMRQDRSLEGDGVVVARFHGEGFLKHGVAVTLGPGPRRSDLTMLVLFGCHVLLAEHEQAAAGASAASAGAAGAA